MSVVEMKMPSPGESITEELEPREVGQTEPRTRVGAEVDDGEGRVLLRVQLDDQPDERRAALEDLNGEVGHTPVSDSGSP